MTKRAVAILAVVSALVAGCVVPGCVVPYDPTGSGRLGGGTGTPSRVVAAPRPSEAAPRPIPGVATPPAPLPVGAATPQVPQIPQTAAGRQAAWVLGALNGRIEKKFEERFDPAFLARVPGPEFRRAVQRWRRDEFGSGPSRVDRVLRADATSVETLVYAPATDRYSRLLVEVDPIGKITAVGLAPAAAPDANATWEGLDAQLAALPGLVSVAALRLGPEGVPTDVHVFGAERPLAISSTARLLVAGAVAEEVVAGRVKWDEILTIQDSLKSLPTGRLQLLPEGTEVRLADAVESMLSPGDNTAADHLMFRIGRERVEAYTRARGAGAGNFPFLSTMELHKLKLTPDRALATRYIAAPETERRSMLAPGGPVELATISPAALNEWKQPRLTREIEWFASARQCATVLADLDRLGSAPPLELLGRALRMNPLVPYDSAGWKVRAYTSGAEPGVLSMAWVLERTDGRRYALALIWNDADRAIDPARLGELAGVAAGLLARERN